MRKRALATLVAAALLLSACGKQELYGGLTEHEATDMAAALDNAGIDASKTSKDGKVWSVQTSQAQFSRAVSVLHDQGLPKERFDDLGDVFKKEGFVSSPVEQHARLIHALQQELAGTISSIDGVVQARVHLAMPEADPLSEKQRPSSASVFIKYNPEVDLTGQVGAIKSLVTNSVEGLPYDKVSVVMFPARPAHVERRPQPYTQMRLPAIGLILIVVGVVAFGFLRRPLGRRSVKRTLPQTT